MVALLQPPAIALFELAQHAIMSPDEGAGATASDWELRHDESSGQAFYLNVKTGESSWDPPALTEPSLPSANFDGSKQQQQWVEAFDEGGNAYYVNLETMETRWTPPPTAAAESSEPQEAATATTAQARRSRRPSTAEQMAELNRLLSGGDDDDEVDVVSSGSDAPVAINQSFKSTGDSGGGCAWMMFVNEGDGQPYYYNHVTGECVWDPPEEFVQFHNQQQDNNKSRPASASIALPPVQVGVPAEGQAQGSSRLDADEEPPQVADGNESAECTSVTITESSVVDDTQSAGADLLVGGSSADDAVVITPEFEKVRRAIEAVSKTPMGSSRLVFFRTPTGLQLPASTRATDGSEQQVDQQQQLSQRLQSPLSARPASATVRVSSSQPSTEEPKPESSETLRIDENAVGSAVDEPSPEAALSDQGELPAALESDEVDISSSGEQNVSGPKDTTGAHMGPSNAPPIDTSELEPPMPGSEREHPRHPDIEAVILASAMILQCAVRCFVARRKVRSKRQEREGSEKQTPEPEHELNEINDPIEHVHIATEDTSGRSEATTAVSAASIDAGVGTVATSGDGVAAEASPTVPDAMPSEQPHAVINGLSAATSSDDTPTEKSPSEPSAAAPEPTASATTSSGVSPPADSTTLPSPVTSRRSPSRATARSARTSIAAQKRDVTCSTPPQCPQVLSLASIFPVRSPRLVGDPDVAKANGNGSTATGAVTEAPRKLPPWMREPVRPTAAPKSTSQNKGDDRANSSSPSSQRALPHQPATPSPDLLQQYVRLYKDGQQKFETERQHLLAERTEQIHATSVKPTETNQGETTVKDDGASSRATLVSSFGHLLDAFELQDEDDKANQEENSAPCNEREGGAAVDPACSDKEADGKRRRHRLKIGRRIKTIEESIVHVEAQLEAAELCLVADDDQVSATKRSLQAKHASKLRRWLRSLLSSAAHWRQVMLTLDKDANKSRYSHLGQVQVPEHRSWCGDSALHYAAWRGWHEQVLSLIKAGVDVNCVDNSVTKWRPLHEASRGGHEAVVRELIAAGASLTAADSSGDTALHVACRGGWLKVVCELLLAAAGGVDASSGRRDTKTAAKKSVDASTAARATVFFSIRNGKHRRAIDLATLPTLVAFLEEYESLLRRERAAAENLETASNRVSTKPAHKKKEKVAAPASRLRV